MRRRLGRALILAATALAAVACAPEPEEASFVQSADGLTGYLGVVPRAVVLDHAPGHEERRMHPSQPTGDAHIVVAIFDDATGERVENAAVEAVVRRDGHPGPQRLSLDRMRIEDTITYGGFLSVAPTGLYHVDVAVRRPGSDGETHLRFVFDAEGLPSGGAGAP